MRWYGRLSGARDVLRVRRRGTRIVLGTFSTYWLAAESGPCRIAVTVSKAVGSAVVRNLVRRRLKGALDRLPPPRTAARLVFVAKPVAANAAYPRLAADVAAALERLCPL